MFTIASKACVYPELRVCALKTLSHLCQLTTASAQVSPHLRRLLISAAVYHNDPSTMAREACHATLVALAPLLDLPAVAEVLVAGDSSPKSPGSTGSFFESLATALGAVDTPGFAEHCLATCEEIATSPEPGVRAASLTVGGALVVIFRSGGLARDVGGIDVLVESLLGVLVAALEDPEPEVRLSAAKALGAIQRVLGDADGEE